MNHHLERDTASLGFALSSPAPYIGVLGPRARFEKMLGALEDAPAEDERVYNPIGVDVGAEAPEEVAVSIVAELLAVRGGYEAGFLRDRDGAHSRSCVARESRRPARGGREPPDGGS